MALNIKPLSDRVLIEPVAAETKTASDFFIPDTAKENRKRNCCCSWGWHKEHTMTVKMEIGALREIFRYRAEIRR
jgi:chaperonin GroES